MDLPVGYLPREERKKIDFDSKYSKTKSSIRDKFITDEFKSGVDYIEMMNSYEDTIKKQIKEKNFNWFITPKEKETVYEEEEE